MRIRLFWPKCDFRNRSKGTEPRDAYWVEATPDEARTYVFPHLTAEQQARSEQEAKRSWDWASFEGDPPRAFCFLVADDLSTIVPYFARYPVHQFWDAYSTPFASFEERWIQSLDEILTMEAPRKVEYWSIPNQEKYGDTYDPLTFNE